MEDWALIRRLAAEGVPKKQIAERLAISRTTVVKAVASSAPPKYERTPAATSFSPFEGGAGAGVAGGASGDAGNGARRTGWLVGLDHVGSATMSAGCARSIAGLIRLIG